MTPDLAARVSALEARERARDAAVRREALEEAAKVCDAEREGHKTDRHRALAENRPENCAYILWAEQASARASRLIRALATDATP